MDLGIPMRVGIRSDGSIDWEQDLERSTSIRDTSGVQERAQDGYLTVKRVPTAKKKCANVGSKPVSASVPPQRCRFAGLVFY